MPLVSSPVADAQVATAAQYNNLRTDLVTNHDHSSGMGAAVSHADLGDGAISGTTYTHAQIDSHIDAGQGVHDLQAAMFVVGGVGISGANPVIEVGLITTGGALSGTTTFTISGGFSTIPFVLCQGVTAPGEWPPDCGVNITARTTTTFNWECTSNETHIAWMAIGTKS